MPLHSRTNRSTQAVAALVTAPSESAPNTAPAKHAHVRRSGWGLLLFPALLLANFLPWVRGMPDVGV